MTALRRRLGAAAHGARTALLVLALGLTVTGVALPSDGEPRPSYVAPAPADPVRLKIPALEVVAPIVPIGMQPGRVLEPPADPATVGWWDVSARPGARRGQTVVTGHTVHPGQTGRSGALDAITELEAGQRVDIVNRKGTVRYRVARVRVLSRAELAEQARALFGQPGGTGRLVLVSCTDWNGSSFDSNVVVLARRV